LVLGEGVERHQPAVELGELAAVASGSHADRREAETRHKFSGLLLAYQDGRRASAVLSDE
jgi:hypothetical protein